MKIIDSDALGILSKALGLTGRGAQVTELTDGIVEQNLDVTPIIRRGRTVAGSEGIFVGVWRNTHAGADSQTSVLSPYALATTQTRAPFETPVRPQFDLWVLDATIIQISGSGTLSGALNMLLPTTMVGLTTTGAGPATTWPIAFWDAVVTEDVEFGLLAGSGVPLAKIGLRLPRGPTNNVQLQFASTSSAAAVFDLQVLFGMFPVSLGQDCVVG